MTNCVVIMAREPRPGAAKTRLAAAIGDVAAAALYQAFLRDTIATCRATSAAVMISYANDAPSAVAYFERIAPGLAAVPQPDGGFGERLLSAVTEGFAAGHARVAVVGSDIPHMRSQWIIDGLARLDTADVALGPTHDGGYYLMALKRPEPTLFRDIDWSSGREFTQTLERAQSLALTVALIEATFDVDDHADLLELQQHLAANDSAACPVTAKAMEAIAQQSAARSAAR